jgi:hypothetical protein
MTLACGLTGVLCIWGIANGVVSFDGWEYLL